MDNSNYYPFIGWIPCVSGRLCFDLTDCGLPRRIEFANFNIEQTDDLGERNRFLLVASDIDWKDKDETSRKTGKPLSGDFIVAVQSCFAPSATSIDGTVHIFSTTTFESNPTQQKLLYEGARELQASALAAKPIHQAFQQLAKDLNAETGNGHWAVDFNISGRGFVRLKPIVKPHRSQSSDEQKLLLRQVYYYLKYTFHRHQHHDQNNDSLTTIHAIAPSADKQGSDNLGEALVQDLKHSIVEMKRKADGCEYETLVRIEGIIAYAESLVVASYAEKLLSKERMDQELQYLENLNRSIQVKVHDFVKGIDESSRKISNINSRILLAFAFIGPFTIVFRDRIREHAQSLGPGDQSNFLIYGMAHALNSWWVTLAFTVFLFIYYQGRQRTPHFPQGSSAFNRDHRPSWRERLLRVRYQVKRCWYQVRVLYSDNLLPLLLPHRNKLDKLIEWSQTSLLFPILVLAAMAVGIVIMAFALALSFS
jgi:hypothetical protein